MITEARKRELLHWLDDMERDPFLRRVDWAQNAYDPITSKHNTAVLRALFTDLKTLVTQHEK